MADLTTPRRRPRRRSRMRITERGSLLSLTGLLVALSLLFAMFQGEMAGFAFPGDLLLWAAGFSVAGAIITKRMPRHAVGRLLMWAGLFSGMNNAFGQGIRFLENPDPAEATGVLLLLSFVFGGGYVFAILALFAAIARFPDGEWAMPWFGWLFWLLAVTFGAVGIHDFADGAGVLWAGWPAWLLTALTVTSGLAATIIVLTVIVKSLRADPVRRRQFAWVVAGLILFGILSALTDRLEIAAIGPLTVLIFPASLVVAVTKYRLYEIDRIVSRTVSYVVVIGLLGATYAGLVLVLRSVVPVEGPLPVALSTLAVAFAFFPVLRRVQRVVDRWFFRSRYDAAGVVAAFANELRSTLDSEVAAARAESVVGETFQAESVSVWLAEEPV